METLKIGDFCHTNGYVALCFSAIPGRVSRVVRSDGNIRLVMPNHPTISLTVDEMEKFFGGLDLKKFRPETAQKIKTAHITALVREPSRQAKSRLPVGPSARINCPGLEVGDMCVVEGQRVLCFAVDGRAADVVFVDRTTRRVCRDTTQVIPTTPEQLKDFGKRMDIGKCHAVIVDRVRAAFMAGLHRTVPFPPKEVPAKELRQYEVYINSAGKRTLCIGASKGQIGMISETGNIYAVSPHSGNTYVPANVTAGEFFASFPPAKSARMRDTTKALFEKHKTAVININKNKKQKQDETSRTIETDHTGQGTGGVRVPIGAGQVAVGSRPVGNQAPTRQEKKTVVSGKIRFCAISK